MVHPTTRIAHDADFPPLTFVDGAESKGVIVDLLTEILGRIGHARAFVAVPLADHEAALRRGEADAVAFKGVVPEFAEIYDFSDSLVTTGGAWFRAREARWGVDQPPAGARVVTPARGPMAGLLRREHRYLALSVVDSYAEALDAVAGGAADVACLNFHIGCYLARRDHAGSIVLPAAPFAPQPIAFSVLEGRHGALLADVNRVLAEVIREGVRDRLERRWLGGAADV